MEWGREREEPRMGRLRVEIDMVAIVHAGSNHYFLQHPITFSIWTCTSEIASTSVRIPTAQSHAYLCRRKPHNGQ